jgi:hypothetical protein
VTARTDWPYDADRDDPLTALRIPVVTSFNPGWKYIAAWVGVDTGPYSWGSSERPTDREARMIASFIREYIEHWFHEGYQRRLAERPLDMDSGCNTTVFVKYGADDWGYRRVSWTYGPTFVPMGPRSNDRHGGPLSLVQVMDHCHNMGSEYPDKAWAQWKTDHPDVFPATA